MAWIELIKKASVMLTVPFNSLPVCDFYLC